MIRWRKRTEAAGNIVALNAGRAAPDAELVYAARRGDKRAFVEIVARHQALVCGVALGILGDFAESEDAAQEAFLTAWRKIHTLREPEQLRAWLAQISRNAALGHLRRRRPNEGLEVLNTIADEMPGPDESAAREDEAAIVRASLAHLPEQYRVPLVLYYREGKSVRAVAESLEISEDAVKQRLARAREMMRENMSGLLENVLSRPGPGAVFTMSVAVAIGALAAPSAIAGTVFGAATAATSASTTTTTASSLASAMSTSKTFIAAAAVVAVACIPVGIRLSTPAEKNLRGIAVEPSKQIGAAASRQPSESFTNSVLFADWRTLHETYGTNSAAMPALYKAIGDLKDPFRKQAFRAALFAEWARVDAAGGLAFLLGKGHGDPERNQFFQEWLSLDPRAAVDGLLHSQKDWESVAREALKDIARKVPERVPDIVSRLPQPESYWDRQVSGAFEILAGGDLAAARKAAEGVTGPNREQALSGVAKVWAKGDIQGTISWAKGLPDGADRDEIIRAALIGKASTDPASALDLVGMVPSGGKPSYFATTTGARVLNEAAQADFDTTVNWLAAHPGRFGHEDKMGLVEAVTGKLNADAAGFLSAYSASGALSELIPAVGNAMLNGSAGQRAAIWDWLKTQPESGVASELKREVLSSAAYQDPTLALRLVTDLPKTPAGDAEVTTLAERLFNGGNMLHRFDQLYQDAPDRLKQPLVSAAFGFLSADNLGDPQTWIARLTELPADARAKGTESIASAWARRSPEEAVGWITGLPASEARDGAAAAIASAWAAKDAPDAVTWVSAMPSGPGRDRSIESVAPVIADTHPREAWDWALSIADPSRLKNAAASVVKAIAMRDPATAQQWIDASSLNSETKLALRATALDASHAAEPQ